MIVHTWNLRSNLLRLQCSCCTVPTTSGRPLWKSSRVSVSLTFVTASFVSSIVSPRQPLSLGNNQKSQEARSGTIGRVRNYLDAHLGQIVGDKDGVVDWCIVLVEMPLTRFEESWPLPMESLHELPLKPQHINPNPNPLANQPWCIDFLTPPTPLIIPHRLYAFLESLMPLKNWCSIYGRWSKTVWSIIYVYVACFPSVLQNFIAYRFY